MPAEQNIREQIIALFKERLGEPHQAELPQGSIYRWTLNRGPHEVSLLITIDSPEWGDMAHVIISDSPTFQADPVTSITVYTIEEAKLLLDRIVKQWKSNREAKSGQRKQ